MRSSGQCAKQADGQHRQALPYFEAALERPRAVLPDALLRRAAVSYASADLKHDEGQRQSRIGEAARAFILDPEALDNVVCLGEPKMTRRQRYVSDLLAEARRPGTEGSRLGFLVEAEAIAAGGYAIGAIADAYTELSHPLRTMYLYEKWGIPHSDLPPECLRQVVAQYIELTLYKPAIAAVSKYRAVQGAEELLGTIHRALKLCVWCITALEGLRNLLGASQDAYECNRLWEVMMRLEFESFIVEPFCSEHLASRVRANNERARVRAQAHRSVGSLLARHVDYLIFESDAHRRLRLDWQRWLAYVDIDVDVEHDIPRGFESLKESCAQLLEEAGDPVRGFVLPPL